MSTLLDQQVGLKKEVTYGTAVTVDRFHPWVDGTKGDWDPRVREGKGLQASGRHAYLGSRTYTPQGRGTVTLKASLESKQAGVLLDIACGVSTVNTITGGAQIIAHDAITGTLLPSCTIQLNTVMNDGTDFTETYAGCTPSKVTFEQPQDDMLWLTVEFDALSRTTATAKATATFPSGQKIFDAFQATAGLGGTLTVPSTTVLATGLTAFPNFRSWKLEIDQAIDINRWVLAASRNQPTAGVPAIKFSGDVEFNSTTLTTALPAGTLLPWYVTYTTTETLGAGNTQLQVVVPQLLLTKGLPAPKPGETVVYSIDADVKNDGTNKDFYVVYRTTDTAL